MFTQNRDEISKDLLEVIAPERIIDSEALKSPLGNILLMSRGGGGLIRSNSTFRG